MYTNTCLFKPTVCARFSENYHFFQPYYGSFTALFLLSESHLSIHTWPEHNYISIDIFTCGNCNIDLMAKLMLNYFKPEKTNITRLSRGSKINIEKTKQEFIQI